ncbi:MAG: TetR/AcrR family transcriptional regulator [Salinivirgaceae bacterium]
MKQKILQNAQEYFFKYGYSKVTLSEISKEMGISKKTIYNHYTGKEELLFAVLDYSKSQFEQQMSSVEADSNKPFREMVLGSLSVLGLWVSKLKTLVNDLKRNHLEAWHHILEIRKDVIIKHTMRVLKSGKKKGILDDNKRSAIAVFLFLASADKITDDTFRSNIPDEITDLLPADPSGMFQSVLEVIYEGIKKS